MVKTLKSTVEIGMMREAGLLLWQTHQFVKKLIIPGANPLNIDMAAEGFIREHGATPTFKGVGEIAHPFPNTICWSVNNQVVHGIPTENRLKKGDIVSVDIGLKLNGWCSDSARTYVVDDDNESKHALVNSTLHALDLAISQLSLKTNWNEIASDMEAFIKSAGFSVVQEYVGHGIGRHMWEDPTVPNHLDPVFDNFKIETGLVLAIEPILTQFSAEVYTDDDFWTVITEDGGLAAHFEDTVAIGPHGPVVLTRGPFGQL